MKRVDHMIKYLSGDLNPEEALAFERELIENPQLKQEFSDVSLAYSMIGDQLRKADEEAFTAALDRAMNRSQPGGRRRKNHRIRQRYLLLAVAASVTLIVSILVPQRGSEKIYSSSYNPSNDPVILALEGNMRGEADHQVLAEFWKKEDFNHCRREAAKQLSENSSEQLAMLFFLLSSMEMDDATVALERLNTFQIDPGQSWGQAITWYKALALVKAGNTTEAAALLTTLCELSGPYQKDANKLKKKLKK